MMKKRPLFVFAGQSNMVGSCTVPQKEQILFKDSYEYLHKARRMGSPEGNFKNYGFPSGEFVYKNLTEAYGDNPDPEVKSELRVGEFGCNILFGSSMCNLDNAEEKTIHPMSENTEKSCGFGTCLQPFIVKGLEDAGHCCAYAHIAKGAVPIVYYFTDDMVASYNEKMTRYNSEHGTDIPLLSTNAAFHAAGEYFTSKTLAFFEDSARKFEGDDMGIKALFWFQGEGDGASGYVHYKTSLEVLWEKAKSLGFTHFFCIRVDYWGDEKVSEVMLAQEDFCSETENAYILTRAASYLLWPNQKEEGWYKGTLPDEFRYGRDSQYGFLNPHINENGFRVIAKYAVPNLLRVLYEGKEPVLEEELVLACVRK